MSDNDDFKSDVINQVNYILKDHFIKLDVWEVRVHRSIFEVLEPMLERLTPKPTGIHVPILLAILNGVVTGLSLWAALHFIK
jgi:hypothetical protein